MPFGAALKLPTRLPISDVSNVLFILNNQFNFNIQNIDSIDDKLIDDVMNYLQ